MEQLQILSRQILFETVPGVVRRKRLSKKVLGVSYGPFLTDPFTMCLRLDDWRRIMVLAIHNADPGDG